MAVNRSRASYETIKAYLLEKTPVTQKALIDEIAQFQKAALEKIKPVDETSIALKILILEKELYFYQSMLIISLAVLLPSMMIMLFTGPMTGMIGVIVLSALLFLMSACILNQKSDHLFLHQEGQKALNNQTPHFSEINDTIESYETQCEPRNPWPYPMPHFE